MIVCKNIIQPISAFYIFTKIYLFLSVYRGTTLGSFLLTKIVSDNSFIIFVNLKVYRNRETKLKLIYQLLFFCIEVDKIMECSYRDILDDRFGHPVIGMSHNIDWPARSSDLTHCNFSSWKSSDSASAGLQWICDLRQNPGMIRRAMRAMQRRVYLCTEKEGRHVEGRDWWHYLHVNALFIFYSINY